MTITQITTSGKETVGYIYVIDGAPLTHRIFYSGKHDKFHGLELLAQVVKDKPQTTEIHVFPLRSPTSIEASPKVDEIPPEIMDEVSEIVRARFGYDKNPKYA